MTRKLTGYVHVDGNVYGPDDEVPADVAAQITNPKAWDGDPDPVDADEAPPEPPRAGPGSGADAWRAYAEGLGLTVPEGAGRDDIVAQVDAAKSAG